MNPYKMLQVDPDAEPEVIEAAYKRLATKYHPDRNPSDSAPQRMQELNAAYYVLKDPERRRAYDREQTARASRTSEAPASRTSGPREEPASTDGREEPKRSSSTPRSSSAQPTQSQPQRNTKPQWGFGKFLGVATLVLLLVYAPWVVGALFTLWVMVWAIRNSPRAAAGVLKLTVGVATALGIAWWVHAQSTEHELAALDIREVLRKEAQDFARSCALRAVQYTPETGTAYCECLTDELRSRFDYSPISASSVSGYRSEFRSRFEAAVPDSPAQARCMQKVQSKIVPTPTTTSVAARGIRKQKSVGPARASLSNRPRTATDAEKLDSAIREALAPRQSSDQKQESRSQAKQEIPSQANPYGL